MGKTKCFLIVLLISVSCSAKGEENYISAVGDPGMRRDGLRVALEAWNFCNEVGKEAPNMGSPRIADCFDVEEISDPPSDKDKDEDGNDGSDTEANHLVSHKVNETINKLGVGKPFPGKRISDSDYINNVDLYAAKKEELLGELCEVRDEQNLPWQFWMVMLKNGNMDTLSGLCPKDGHKVGPFPPESRFPCSEKGQCMNQPLVYHDYTKIDENDYLKGRFYGTWEIDADVGKGTENISYFSVEWEKGLGSVGWKFHHVLQTSQKYPWLMLYLRSDATKGLSGGYHYQTRGMSKIIPESPNFKVKLTLDIKKGGGPKSQFYLLDMGSCWKNNGTPCDGDVTTDVTRYSEMIINPETEPWCRPNNLDSCPPYHTFANGTRVHRTDARLYPHSAYHMYCSPGNGKYLEEPYNVCDQYSNPQPQEILQILPHPVWGEYGYPTRKGEGWVGDARSWELDVGGMSHNLYFYQDPGTTPVNRKWPSIDVGTEIYVSNVAQVAEWTLSEFDILIPTSTVGAV